MELNFLTAEEFAKRIKMSRATVIRSIKSGKIFGSRLSMGKRSPWRIPETELERLYIDSMYKVQK